MVQQRHSTVIHPIPHRVAYQIFRVTVLSCRVLRWSAWHHHTIFLFFVSRGMSCRQYVFCPWSPTRHEATSYAHLIFHGAIITISSGTWFPLPDTPLPKKKLTNPWQTWQKHAHFPRQTPRQIAPAICSANTMATAGTLTPGKSPEQKCKQTHLPPPELEQNWNRKHLLAEVEEMVPPAKLEHKRNKAPLPPAQCSRSTTSLLPAEKAQEWNRS